MFKRGGFASYTKTGRRIQYGAAFGALMAIGRLSKSENRENNEESRSFFGYILFIIFVYILLNGMIQSTKHKQPQ